MEMTDMLVFWVVLQTLESRRNQGLRLPAHERRGKDPIEDHKIILQLVDHGATEQTTPTRHNPFVFSVRPDSRDQDLDEDGLQVNFMTIFNFHKPGRRS